MFDEVVETHSQAPALRMRQAATSYAALDRLSNQFAHWLTGQGVGVGDVVGIFHDKSVSAYAAMLGCLKTGVVYTNLDPNSPWKRLQKIVDVCRPVRILSFDEGDQHTPQLSQAGIAVVEMSSAQVRDAISISSDSLPQARAKLNGNSPAYIMFTSGSTGIPKGAVMSHANLINFVMWAKTTFGIGEGDTLTGANPMYFDNSVFDFYGALFTGAALRPISADEVRDPRRLVRIVNEDRCTVWFSVPSLLVYLLTTRAVNPKDLSAVRKLVFGGEGFPKPKLKQLFDMFGERIELENVYGPTECTCICSSHRVCADDFSDMQSLTTLGYLSPNFDYDILSVEDTDTDNGTEVGELFLRGPQVGLGYYNDPKRTAEAFVQNPCHQHYRDIGYRTGDLVRRDESGRLHFQGRKDFQIKHMGYRIELEEIEAALATVPHVTECAVIYQSIAAGMGQILGYVAVDDRHFERDTDFVAKVAELVPAYMVPRRIQVLPALPKNANGKIDRNQLHQQTGNQS